MSFEHILVDVDGTIGRLTLNRPEKLNALSGAVLREIADAARYFDEQPDLRVVIVSGKGRSFTAGADLNDSAVRRAADDAGSPWLERREAGYLGQRMADALENMRATTIAQLHGYVIGGGVVIASACDLRVASDDTIFSIPEVDLGIPLTWGGIPRLVRDIGPAMTKELVMTCRRFDAAEAKAIGFINRVEPRENLETAVESLATGLAAKPSVPVALTKAQVNAAAWRGVSSFADGDLLLGAASAPESAAVAKAYSAWLSKKRKDA